MAKQPLTLAPEEELLLASVLAECLEAMDEGESNLDALAGRHPPLSARIKPLLEVAQALRERRPLAPVPTPELLLGWQLDSGGRYKRLS